MKTLGEILIWGFILLVALTAIYGLCWGAKTLSYSFFYEDLVRQTVIETVRAEALR